MFVSFKETKSILQLPTQHCIIQSVHTERGALNSKVDSLHGLYSTFCSYKTCVHSQWADKLRAHAHRLRPYYVCPRVHGLGSNEVSPGINRLRSYDVRASINRLGPKDMRWRVQDLLYNHLSMRIHNVGGDKLSLSSSMTLGLSMHINW
mmetsp:Transcript_12288/g.28364  ORF Transcript_12288/g.28364 Transcript_12288/m.28364 type:complete len:149 (+) Transcript_12288:740-1186(+)